MHWHSFLHIFNFFIWNTVELPARYDTYSNNSEHRDCKKKVLHCKFEEFLVWKNILSFYDWKNLSWESSNSPKITKNAIHSDSDISIIEAKNMPKSVITIAHHSNSAELCSGTGEWKYSFSPEYRKPSSNDFRLVESVAAESNLWTQSSCRFHLSNPHLQQTRAANEILSPHLVFLPTF